MDNKEINGILTFLSAVIFMLAIVLLFTACPSGDGGPGGGGGGDPVQVNIAAIQGVTPPVYTEVPKTAITASAQYTGTIAWREGGTPFTGETFAANKTYTATITLTPKSGYTFNGIAADFFTVVGATTVSNAVNSGVVTAVFPETGAIATSVFIFNASTGTITGYTGAGGTIVIPSTINGVAVITLGNYAFYNKQLTSVTIPNSVTTIGDYAFFLNRLTDVTIGNNVETIGNSAFSFNQLISVTIPDSVITIGNSAFSPNHLTGVIIGNRVEIIGGDAFNGAMAYGDTRGNQLTSVTIPNSVTIIGERAFDLQNSLISVTIGANVTIEGISIGGSSHTYGFPYDFKAAYETVNNKASGTYTRPGANYTFSIWTKQ